MRSTLKIFRIRNIGTVFLAVLALAAVFPVLFSLYTIKESGYWIWSILHLAMAGFIVWLCITYVSWPEDWIPPQWSDFAFWQKKIASFSSDFKLYLALPKSAIQTRQLILGGKTICCGLLSAFLYLLMKICYAATERKNNVDFEQKNN